MTSPVFIEITESRKLLETFDLIKRRYMDARSQLRELDVIRAQEKHLIERLHDNLAEMRERVSHVDKHMELS